MIDPFIELVDDVISHEGKYSNDPADAGGETNWGITVFTARAFGYTGAMKSMSRDQAIVIYRARYWEQPGFDQLYLTDHALSFKLFDIGVNMGQTSGVGFLQRALNALNQQGSAYEDLTVDGHLGNMTLHALNKFYATRGAEGQRVLFKMVEAQQSVYYMELSESKPINERFEYGWQSQRAFTSTNMGVA